MTEEEIWYSWHYFSEMVVILDWYQICNISFMKYFQILWNTCFMRSLIWRPNYSLYKSNDLIKDHELYWQYRPCSCREPFQSFNLLDWSSSRRFINPSSFSRSNCFQIKLFTWDGCCSWIWRSENTNKWEGYWLPIGFEKKNVFK